MPLLMPPLMPKALPSAIENRALIEKILKQFSQILSTPSNNANNNGLLSGLTGELLFLFKLSQYYSQNNTENSTENSIDETIFNDKLEFLQQQLATSVGLPNLSSGLCGQGWFLEYINQAQGEDYDAELCEEIDDILHHALNPAQASGKESGELGELGKKWSGDIEMVLGLGGFAVYASRRQLKSAPSAIYERLINHFEQTAMQITEHTLSWSQPADSTYRFNKDAPQTPEFNLGLAHGVPGIIAAILPAVKIPALHQRAKSLLIQSCDWLLQQELQQKLPADQQNSYFSSSCNNHKGSRLGWCYGDLTIALTLARVGKALDHPAYIDKAKQISLHSAQRDSENGYIQDAGLCHGSAGVALIFQQLNQQFNLPELSDAADQWLSYTLDLYREKGLSGFYMFSGLTQEYEECTGFLMGYSGIGLCLLAALGETPDWADCLLMA